MNEILNELNSKGGFGFKTAADLYQHMALLSKRQEEINQHRYPKQDDQEYELYKLNQEIYFLRPYKNKLKQLEEFKAHILHFQLKERRKK